MENKIETQPRRGLMKPVTREQWTTALRSGQYKQGTGQLYMPTSKSFCCLGVLAHLAGGEPVKGEDSVIKFPNGALCHAFIPKELEEMLGIEDQVVLSRMNDLGNTFEEIADYIDSMPTKVFK